MKSTSLDIIPTKFPKEVIDTVVPSILLIINSSLANLALVQPLLKKPNLSKLLEKNVVSTQLEALMCHTAILETCKSGLLL